MKLQFKNEHLSIKEFDSIELTDFSILTGVNGSGKTHLLQSIKNGNSQIDSIATKDIVFFDFIQFKAENEDAFSKEQVTQERQAAWQYFVDTQNRGNAPIIKHDLTKIKNQFLQESDCTKLRAIAKQKGKVLFNLEESDFSNGELKNKFLNYKHSIDEFFSQPQLSTNPQAQSIHALSKKLDGFIDEIYEFDFMNLYISTALKENFLPMKLGKIFLDYRVKEYEEYHKNLEKANPSTDFNQLKTMAQQKCKEMFGGSAPWEIINEFLNSYGNFQYTITYPEGFTTETYSYKTRQPFTPVLTNGKKNLSIVYQNLSSGEQILFSLALCLFKGKSDNIFPKLLLLDEVDATLHPSMIGNLLHVIQNVLLKKGTKVILATHSPTTIALAPEESIFIVNKEGKNRFEKHDKKDALGILTEGYMTMEEGIKLFDQISKKEISIITEGNNIEYIKKAAEFFAAQNKDKIEIIKGVESNSGKTQLKTLFDFFTKVNHDKKVIIVWDSDYHKSLNEENKTYPFIFEKNSSNNIALAGIENLFDEQLFDSFVMTKTDSKGIQTKYFDGNRKKDFMNHVLSKATYENFKNFKPLFDYINLKLNQ